MLMELIACSVGFVLGIENKDRDKRRGRIGAILNALVVVSFVIYTSYAYYKDFKRRADFDAQLLKSNPKLAADLDAFEKRSHTKRVTKKENPRIFGRCIYKGGSVVGNGAMVHIRINIPSNTQSPTNDLYVPINLDGTWQHDLHAGEHPKYVSVLFGPCKGAKYVPLPDRNQDYNCRDIVLQCE